MHYSCGMNACQKKKVDGDGNSDDIGDGQMMVMVVMMVVVMMVVVMMVVVMMVMVMVVMMVI